MDLEGTHSLRLLAISPRIFSLLKGLESAESATVLIVILIGFDDVVL
jgi:hypothetical protein